MKPHQLPALRCVVLAAASLFGSGCTSAPLMPLAAPLMPALRQALDSAGEGVRTPSGGSGLASPSAFTAPVVAAVSSPVLTAQTSAPVPRPVQRTVPTSAQDDLALAVPPGKNERRFSLTIGNASPDVLFMSLLSETPLSVAVDPAVKGPLSITLKDVTLREALDLLRELHGLEYKVIGRHIVVSPAQMQTSFYNVDYPSFNRAGRSETRVAGGSISGGGSGGGGSSGSSGSTGSGQSAGGQATGGGGGGSSQESSHVSTQQRNDVWGELEASIKLLVGDKDGRKVVVSAQTGTIIVRAMPKEQRAVAEYLEAARVSVQRQVMLEAKIVEVQLRDSERAGINWSAFKAGLVSRATGGILSPGASLAPQGAINGSLVNVTPGQALQSAASNVGSLLGLAFQTTNFAAVLEFLGTQGNTQVLSSPRIATMNNQKAVLKVGTDDFFVTNVSTTSSTGTGTGNGTGTTTPTISLQPFFSGISLDVTPNINAEGFITLHIHPAVTTVTERNKVLSFGNNGTYTLPLASSDINESDAVVRARDGNIIAIGGLMRQTSAHADSGVPGTEGSIFRKLLGGQSNTLSEKRELVILLKPTIIDPNKDDNAGGDALTRLLDWTEQVQRAKK